MKPSWDEAPEWAVYLTQDMDGCWVWHEKKPQPRTNGEWFSYGLWSAYGFPENPKWKSTLEVRP